MIVNCSFVAHVGITAVVARCPQRKQAQYERATVYSIDRQ
jgi:hypothetical protein